MKKVNLIPELSDQSWLKHTWTGSVIRPRKFTSVFRKAFYNKKQQKNVSVHTVTITLLRTECSETKHHLQLWVVCDVSKEQRHFEFRKQFTGRLGITAQRTWLLRRRVIKRWTISLENDLTGSYHVILNHDIVLWQPLTHAFAALYPQHAFLRRGSKTVGPMA